MSTLVMSLSKYASYIKQKPVKSTKEQSLESMIKAIQNNSHIYMSPNKNTNIPHK
jgi:hypothetical protein